MKPPRAGEVIPEVTVEELLRACNRVGNNKAPRPDGILNIVLKTAICAQSEMFTEVYTRCLREGKFPDMEDSETGVVAERKQTAGTTVVISPAVYVRHSWQDIGANHLR